MLGAWGVVVPCRSEADNCRCRPCPPTIGRNHARLNRVWCSGNIVDSHCSAVTVLSTAPGSTPGIRVSTFLFPFFCTCLYFCHEVCHASGDRVALCFFLPSLSFFVLRTTAHIPAGRPSCKRTWGEGHKQGELAIGGIRSFHSLSQHHLVGCPARRANHDGSKSADGPCIDPGPARRPELVALAPLARLAGPGGSPRVL